MSVQLQQQKEGKLIEVHLTGKLSRDDYVQFGPVVEDATKQYGNVRYFDQQHMKDARDWLMGHGKN
jgi:hypothetical protein